MELFVSYESPEHEEEAFNLAKEFGLIDAVVEKRTWATTFG